jgi:hypothetical protein
MQKIEQKIDRPQSRKYSDHHRNNDYDTRQKNLNLSADYGNYHPRPNSGQIQSNQLTDKEKKENRLKQIFNVRNDMMVNRQENPFMFRDEVPYENITNNIYEDNAAMSMINFEGYVPQNFKSQEDRLNLFASISKHIYDFRETKKDYKTVKQQNPHGFKDMEFPANLESISKDPSKLTQKLTSITWQRIKDIDKNRNLTIFGEQLATIDNRPTTVYNQASIFDITQGDLGNCYFMAPLASFINSKSDEASKIVYFDERNFKYSKIGLYQVNLWIDGEQKETLIDDFLPVSYITGKTAFAKITNNVLWPLLIEKAWAKLTKGYLNISSGTCLEGLQAVTGAPVDNFKVENETVLSLCKRLYQLLKVEKRIMTACTNLAVKDQSLEPCHAYSLLDILAIEVSNSRSGAVQMRIDKNWNGDFANGRLVLIKLRNPWGASDKYSGDWSRESEKWTGNEALKVELYGDKRDGLFYLTVENFIEYFSEFDVAFYSPYSKQEVISVQYEGQPYASLRMLVVQRGQYFLSLTQPNPRMHEEIIQQPLRRTSLLLFDMRQSLKPDFVGGLAKNRLSLYIKQDLEPGEYCVILSNLDNVNRMTLSVQGPSKVTLRKENKDKDAITSVIRYGFMSLAKKSQWIETKTLWKHKHQLMTNGYGFLYFENLNDQPMHLCLNMTSFDCLEFIDDPEPDSANKNIKNFSVSGRDEKLILYRQTNAPCKIKYEVQKVERYSPQQYQDNNRNNMFHLVKEQ